ncbi:MAG: LLM class F420-dependent oxidoreductase [Acidimicrobiaceae bacterium]|mgnify:FL=1|jgi:probable F420-dependent oxidoreductase|nr:LLM class F420-dependent oxidoreductase [Acidimicrobiaceae bacterium]MEC9112996.1 TIGR03619 family F420-dependent LLM class oxidoreductase [Actinomycetota bacterium]|tara:strand:+ start:3223 stop:4104 length:882 start_codon:yes stop_codon:yes gene_type:complete
MKFGYLTGNHAEGILPGDLARELEARGFDSVWFPEHSHIPVDRRSPYPNGGPLPGSYFHMMDPWVSIAAAAAETTTLTLGTGICLLLEHDLLDLACAVATADVLAEGRVVMGIGVGWNEEELENHRPDLPFKKRYSAMRERVEALRTAWRDEEATFSGTWDSFSTSWVFPKPVKGTVPIALGNAGPLGIQHAAEYADEWAPIDVGVMNTDGKPDVLGGIQRFRNLADEAGRDGSSIPISLYIWGRPRQERLEQYAEAGVTQFVFTPVNFDLPSADDTLRYIDELASAVEEFRS